MDRIFTPLAGLPNGPWPKQFNFFIEKGQNLLIMDHDYGS